MARIKFISICHHCHKPFFWYGYEGWDKLCPITDCFKCFKQGIDNFMTVLEEYGNAQKT